MLSSQSPMARPHVPMLTSPSASPPASTSMYTCVSQKASLDARHQHSILPSPPVSDPERHRVATLAPRSANQRTQEAREVRPHPHTNPSLVHPIVPVGILALASKVAAVRDAACVRVVVAKLLRSNAAAKACLACLVLLSALDGWERTLDEVGQSTCRLRHGRRRRCGRGCWWLVTTGWLRCIIVHRGSSRHACRGHPGLLRPPWCRRGGRRGRAAERHGDSVDGRCGRDDRRHRRQRGLGRCVRAGGVLFVVVGNDGSHLGAEPRCLECGKTA